jgi:hypothetical protein
MSNFNALPNDQTPPMKCLLIFVTLFVGSTTAHAQLTEYTPSDKGWTMYSELGSLGFSKASLQYVVNESDTTFLLMMWDQRPEIKSYFSIKFSSDGNTLHSLYEILLSFFEKDNWRNKDYIRIFRLGDQKVSVYRAAMIETKAIMFSTDKGRIQFTRREVEKLFGRK